MKRIKCFIVIMFLIIFAMFCGCNEDGYKLDESTFFLVMTNMQYYPEQYLEKNIEYDCFTYDLKDVEGKVYRCGVRKCSSGYGCRCGKDTVIGFILDYDGEIPSPRNQSEDTVEKTWIHLKGTLITTEKQKITVYAYNADGSITSDTETIEFLTMKVFEINKITDYDNLKYYVTK